MGHKPDSPLAKGVLRRVRDELQHINIFEPFLPRFGLKIGLIDNSGRVTRGTCSSNSRRSAIVSAAASAVRYATVPCTVLGAYAGTQILNGIIRIQRRDYS